MARQTNFVCLIFSFTLCMGPSLALAAQDSFAPLVQSMDKMAAKHERDEAAARLARKFHPFMVAQESAELLLNGVQYSKSITLMSPASGEVEHISPATKPMSIANAYVALSLVRLDLAQYGISQPTPAQLKWAMNGGSFRQTRINGQRTIRLKGVLKQRAQGRSWDAVAKSIGVKADKAHYEMEAAKFVLMNTAVTPSYSSIKAFPEGQDDGQGTVRQAREKAYGAGIVTANGASPTILKSINGETVEGIVTASGDFIVLGLAGKKNGQAGSQ